ncbi:MAG: metal transporter, partial [Planctomyces sp.]|nr:metal transporter [Planctomyces sp.]
GGSQIQDKLATKITPAARRLAQIEVAPASRREVDVEIETVGALAVDESRLATISAYIDGRVEKMFADYTGVRVAKNDHLANLYSPSLYAAQVEYLQSSRALRQMNDRTLEAVRETQQTLVKNSRQKLIELGMTEEQIKELEESESAKSRLTIYSPIGGTVLQKLVKEGDYVKAGDPIYQIADLSTVWLMLELFPEEASRIRFGQQVEAEVQSMPDEVFMGRVAFIDPTVNSQTRTVGVRVEFLNLQGKLRPGDYATATIYIPVGSQGEVYDSMLAGKWISPMHPQIIRDEPGDCPICGMDLVPTSEYGFSEEPIERPESLVVPRSAVLMAGDDSVVYVEKEKGVFEIRPVTMGPILEEEIVILSGLEEGEQVAVSGNFLIDSQMQLEGKPSLIDVSRAVEIQAEQKTDGPLDLSELILTTYDGDTGKRLEALYTAYLPVQQQLADDKAVSEEAASGLRAAAESLVNDEQLEGDLQDLANEIASASEHLHHMEIAKARESFKPISHAVLRLARQARGSGAEEDYIHFYCPMVEGGGGDWLQATEPLLNPYWGSEMLHCGENVESLEAMKK